MLFRCFANHGSLSMRRRVTPPKGGAEDPESQHAAGGMSSGFSSNVPSTIPSPQLQSAFGLKQFAVTLMAGFLIGGVLLWAGKF
mmetsp:Transcript_24830/g.69073  ORF Transcript_24830/g.69073 Transcript_24830/m.69073 type:complete len:84 (-) Transcript_24830:498-749(-)